MFLSYSPPVASCPSSSAFDYPVPTLLFVVINTGFLLTVGILMRCISVIYLFEEHAGTRAIAST